MAGETNQSPGQYMRGSCFALAVYLADRCDYTLYGAFDDAGDMHHAFVADPRDGRAYDGRGETSLAGVLVYRGRRLAATNIRPVERDSVVAHAHRAMSYPTDDEIRRFVKRGRFPTLRRRRPAAAT